MSEPTIAGGSGAGTDATGNDTAGRVSVATLTMMVVGGMVGAGVFSLPRRFATETGIWGALIAWGIAGGGMLMLAFVFQALAVRKPALRDQVWLAASDSANWDRIPFESESAE